MFAAKPQSYQQKVNRKMHRGALRSILSELVRQERLVVVDEIKIEKPKTKIFIKQLADWKLGEELLIITESVDTNMFLAARNLPHIDIRDVAATISDPAALVGAEKILITTEAIKKLEEVLA